MHTSGRQDSAAPRGTKADAVFNDCIYQIATGAWKPGDRLPALRDAKARWGINEVTCFRVYRRLVNDGLVVTRDRSGYFIADAAAVGHLSDRARPLRDLYTWFARAIRSRGELSTLGAARALHEMAEAELSARPTCAFVECTEFQAESHAAEIRERLEVPCLALRTGDHLAIPASVRYLVTTPFHAAEVRRAARRVGALAMAAPIEILPALLDSLRRSRSAEFVVLGLKHGLAQSAAADLRARLPSENRVFHAKASSPETLARDAAEALARGRRTLILSPSLWSAAGSDLRGRPVIRPLEYRIVPSAWIAISRLLGLVPSTSSAGQECPVRAHC
ncbi:MAG: GntR family transcriptional regulator [Phycisphaerales bacterium]|nr:GntR family transcriptional regulator [Planctomycetota bacterium]